jgi:hypothetical protein
MLQDYGIKESKKIDLDTPLTPEEYRQTLENQKNENLLKKIRSLSTNQSNDKKIIKNDNLQMHKSIID